MNPEGLDPLTQAINQLDLATLILEFYPHCGAIPHQACRCRADWRDGERDSVSIWWGSTAWMFTDHATDLTGNAHTFLTDVMDYNKSKAAEELIQRAGLSHNGVAKNGKHKTVQSRSKTTNTKPKGKIIATYPYTDEVSELLFEVVRYEPKKFLQRKPDGKGGWEWKLGRTRRVLYRLPEVVKAAREGETVFITEGEKDADNLAALGLCATTCPMGANKWHQDYSESLKGAQVVILPDNDTKGLEHAQVVAEALSGVAESVEGG